MLKYVLFDLDGTLTESAPGILNSVRYALRHYGVTDYDESSLNRFVGPPLIESFKRFCGFSEEKAQEAVNVYREYFAEKGIFENSPYGGIHECLQKLKNSGLTLAVATSKPEVFCRRILEKFGLTEYFTVIKGIPFDNEHMTKAQVIAGVLGELGVEDLSSAVMVGDRDYDVYGAKENGLRCVGVLYGYGSREELESAGAARLAGTVEEMGRTLLQM